MIPDRVMRKIERCLALSKSANSHEAGIALRQAQALMAQYGVRQEDLALSDFDEACVLSRSGITPPRYLEYLAQLINRSFGTVSLYSARRDWSSSGRLKASGCYKFVGPRDACRVAGYAYEVLQRQLLRDRRAFMNTLSTRLKRETKRRRGDAFAEAWVAGAQQIVTPVAMTPDRQALAERYLERRYGNLQVLEARGHQPLKRHDQRAVTAGYRAGSAARLSAGVDATHREALTQGSIQ
ncbi:DUF2786 domain-containing protein [Vreelandella zhaodongensis]|uniref:DUF2786 domain-containing protein n=1 Tax=Vreelandella zhaodongensis TaxID=1176240 RepID=UPI003EB9AFB8